MRLVCATCGAVASIEAWLNDPVCREALGILSALPENTSDYIGLFRARNSGITSRGLRWPRVLTLAKELQTLVSSGWVKGKDGDIDRPATRSHWGQAITRMVNFPPRKTPLKNHNYLIAVVYDMASETAWKSETHRNRKERNGTFREGGDATLTPLRYSLPAPAPAPAQSIEDSYAQSKKMVRAYAKNMDGDELRKNVQNAVKATRGSDFISKRTQKAYHKTHECADLLEMVIDDKWLLNAVADYVEKQEERHENDQETENVSV